MCVAQRDDGAVCAEMLLKEPQVVGTGSGKPFSGRASIFDSLFSPQEFSSYFKRWKKLKEHRALKMSFWILVYGKIWYFQLPSWYLVLILPRCHSSSWFTVNGLWASCWIHFFLGGVVEMVHPHNKGSPRAALTNHPRKSLLDWSDAPKKKLDLSPLPPNKNPKFQADYLSPLLVPPDNAPIAATNTRKTALPFWWNRRWVPFWSSSNSIYSPEYDYFYP